jgi:hypothetical protein
VFKYGGWLGEIMQRISRGEAQAAFETGFTGFLHNRGPKDDANSQVVIKPYFPNGRRYCVEDWHVLLAGLYVDEPNDGVTSAGQAKALFAPTTMAFVLDGKALETTRQPVKPLLGDFPGKAYVLVQGRLVAPGELAAGSHTLTVTIENDPVVPGAQVFTSQFFIDAAGTGACV